MLRSLQGEPNLLPKLSQILNYHIKQRILVRINNLTRNLPLALRELVVQLMFAVGVKVEDALNEVLAKHFWVFLQ